MRVLVVISGLELGGAEVQVSQLCDQFYNNGIEVRLVSMMGDVVVQPRTGNIVIDHLGMKKNILSLFHSAKRYISILREFRPDIVSAHLYHANIFTRIMYFFCANYTLINSEHSKFVGSELRALCYKLTRRVPRACTNVSQEALGNFIDKGAFIKGSAKYIYNGIDTDKFIFSEMHRQRLRNEFRVPTERKIIMSIGRLVTAKDYPTLLNAFKKCDFSNSELWIIGDGKEKNALLSMVHELGIDNRVKFLGARRDIHQLLSACDLFVLSSAWEGFALVVAEAMSCQRLVVATDAGGVKEVMGSDSEWLVEVKNIDELTHKINKALQLNKYEVDKITSRGRNRIISHYSLSTIASQWIAFYKSFE